MKIILISLLVFSATLFVKAQSEAIALVDKSIKYHDPKNNWEKLKVDIQVNSIVDRNGKIDSSQRNIFFDLKKNQFEMEFTQKDMEVQMFLDSNNCGAKVTNKPELSENELKELNITCDRAKMYNSYYRYLIGMPMKLKDPGTIIHEQILSKNYKGTDYDVVNVTYDPEVGTYTWLFYFDKKSTELVLTEFSKDGSFQNGETIELNNKAQYQKMLLPGQLMWYVLPDRPFLAEENIIYSVPAKKK